MGTVRTSVMVLRSLKLGHSRGQDRGENTHIHTLTYMHMQQGESPDVVVSEIGTQNQEGENGPRRPEI